MSIQKTSATRKNRKVTKIDPALEKDFHNVKINWVPAILLLLTPPLALILVPWYGFTYGFTSETVIVFAIFAAWSGLGITAGYHRLWSHKTYDANIVVRFILLVGATLAIQNTAFEWCAGHRVHHGQVDDVYKDPYSAKRGFWFSHLGWMLKKFPSGVYDYKRIKDLTSDPMLQFQHKFYIPLIIITNIAMPLGIGYLIGDMWGTFILAGLGRLVLSHHFTFFINSLAHMWGTQPYTDKNSARDNGFLAFFTWGEGYHNYHHIFENDYRNGIYWWQYDPTKWLIYSLSKVGLTSNLKRVSHITVQRAKLDMKFKTVQSQLDGTHIKSDSVLDQFKERVSAEYDVFMQNIEEWRAIQKTAMQRKKDEKKRSEELLDEKSLGEKSVSEHALASINATKRQLQNSLNQKLSEIDARMEEQVKLVELKMKHQHAQLVMLTKLFKKGLA